MEKTKEKRDHVSRDRNNTENRTESNRTLRKIRLVGELNRVCELRIPEQYKYKSQRQ